MANYPLPLLSFKIKEVGNSALTNETRDRQEIQQKIEKNLEKKKRSYFRGTERRIKEVQLSDLSLRVNMKKGTE